MDLDFLREHPETIDRLIEHQRIRVTTIEAGPICTTQRLTLEDGTDLFAKELTAGLHPMNSGDGSDFFTAEARALEFLREPGAVPVPELIAATPGFLVLEWVQPGKPTAAAAARFGRGLAELHTAEVAEFGAPWPGYVGTLPLDNRPLADWAEFYVERRLRPYVRYGFDTGLLTSADLTVLETAMSRIPDRAGPAAAPSRIHGDLWTGNVLYGTGDRAWLVDPAAHGGHRETDIASLRLFGVDFLDEIVAAYQEINPLADGWQERVGIHQLHLLLVSCLLYGPRNVRWTLDVARSI